MAFQAVFKGSKTLTSRGFKACVECGMREINVILFVIAKSITSIEICELWASRNKIFSSLTKNN